MIRLNYHTLIYDKWRFLKMNVSLIFILIVSFLLRIISLNQSFWLDETTSAGVARDLSYSQIITKFSLGDFHPPLYYLLLRLWSQVFGISEVSARGLSIVFGLATVYVVFLLGKKLFDRKIGVVAALLLATSGLHVYYSQEARMYAMTTFFTALAFYLFTRVGERRGKFWLLFSLVLPLIFLTDYLPITILSVFWVFGLLFRQKNFLWWRNFLLSQIPLLVAALAWFPIFWKQFLGGLSVRSSAWWDILGRTTFKEVLLIPAKFIIGRVSLENKLVYPLLLGVLFLVFGFLIFKALRNGFKKENTTLTVLWLFMPVFITILIGLKISVLSYFRLLFVIPAFYLLLAKGISSLDKRWQRIALVTILAVNLLSVGAYLFNPRFHREDWRELVSMIEASRGKNSLVLFPANSQMEAYHYYAPHAIISGPEGFDSKSKEIWLLRYVQTIFDPEDKLRFKIEDLGFKKMGEYNFNGVVVWRYTK